MARVQSCETMNRALTMFTLFILSLMDMLISFLHITRAIISYITTTCVNAFSLHPPCFHPGIIRPSTVDSAHFHDIRNLMERRTAQNCKRVLLSHLQSYKQRLDKSGELFLDRSPNVVSLAHGEQKKIQRKAYLKVFPEDLIDDDASKECQSTLIPEHNILSSSSDAKTRLIFANHDAMTAIEKQNQHACFSTTGEPSTYQPIEEIEKPNARSKGGASHVFEAGLDSRGSQVGGCKLDMSAATTLSGFQAILGQKKSDLEVVVRTSRIVDQELHVHEVIPFKSKTLCLELKAELLALQHTLGAVHAELERERNASSSAAQESMTLISVLQKEKAALLLDFMQHQRVAEEKEMFDENSLIDLRDSLVKREAELLALEKEMELYWWKILKIQSDNLVKEHPHNGVIFKGAVHFLQEHPDVERVSGSGRPKDASRLYKSSAWQSSFSAMEVIAPHAEKDTSGVSDHFDRQLGRLSNSPPDLRSMSMIDRDTSRLRIKKEASELLCRLCEVEADRDLLRRALELRRKERWEMRLLQEVAGSLKLLHSSSRKKGTMGSRVRLHRACSVSIVEAQIFRAKRPQS